ncbi:MAG TPA: glycosyltransferase family 2 protein [Ruminiclostridium sp.]|nr:glycosyltransferase family 2 protein [Ruminiclostridium sp.]
MITDFKNGTATFVMAHWTLHPEESRKYMEDAVEGIFKQTDGNWQIVIVDDFSPLEAREYLLSIKKRSPEKIHLILKESNDGPGITRNIGIEWAYKNNSPIILYNDADDISHPRRLETVRKIFMDDPEAGVVYSTFQIIDENNDPVDEKNITPSIIEIIESLKDNPVQGEDAWIQIGTLKGYINLTSSTAVKTDLAYKYPFPEVRVSEDQHTWLRYSAGGGKFVYTKDIPSFYRIPRGKPTVSRSRIERFYEQKAAVDTDGFMEAIRIYDETTGMRSEDKDDLLIKFYLKLAETLGRENLNVLAHDQVAKAAAISRIKTEELINLRGFQKNTWAKI